jgi:hypothetical protein
VRQAERDQGRRAGVTSTERDRLRELERENRELKRANEILRKASAYFAWFNHRRLLEPIGNVLYRVVLKPTPTCPYRDQIVLPPAARAVRAVRIS